MVELYFIADEPVILTILSVFPSGALFSFNTFLTPGNVARGNQNYDNEIITRASGHELQSVDRMSRNLSSRYLQISRRENRYFGNVVPNSFHFYTRLVTKLHETKKQKQKKQAVIF